MLVNVEILGNWSFTQKGLIFDWFDWGQIFTVFD